MKVLILLIILCFVTKVCVVIQGRYIVEVRLNGYSNPTGKCADSVCNTASGQVCCDGSDTTVCTGDERCDSYFIYCLRPLGEVRQNPACYEYEKRGQSSANTNDGSLDFSQSAVLGLPNPRNLSIWHWEPAYEGIQVYIEVQDSDTNQDNLVDILLIDHNLTVAQSLQQNHTGMYNIVTMDLTITVICAEKFQGENCTQCVPGFTGSNCTERDYCFGVNCSGSGECMNNFNSFTCMCDRGYSGRLCENLNCFENICSGNGQCLNALSSCNCSAGFTGRVCEININDCSSNPCGEGGQCVDGVNNFQCICNPGFTGELCQTNIDDCMGIDCGGNGQCLDGVNNFICNCTPGYSGSLCSEAIASDSVATSLPVYPRILAGALGGAGTMLILILILLLTIACLRRKSKMMNCSESPPQLGLFDAAAAEESAQQLQLESNKAYASTTHYIPTEENVAYGQTAPQISTEDNVAYDQIAPRISTEDNVAYGQTAPRISTEDNVAYGQTALRISTEDNVAYGRSAPQIFTEDNPYSSIY